MFALIITRISLLKMVLGFCYSYIYCFLSSHVALLTYEWNFSDHACVVWNGFSDVRNTIFPFIIFITLLLFYVLTHVTSSESFETWYDKTHLWTILRITSYLCLSPLVSYMHIELKTVRSEEQFSRHKIRESATVNIFLRLRYFTV